MAVHGRATGRREYAKPCLGRQGAGMLLAAALSLLLLACGSLAPASSGNLAAASSAPAAQGASHTARAGETSWQGQRFAVASAHPLATEAGAEILRAGGAAIDAAVAVQMVLTLVEPQASGIGGGAFLLHHDGRQTIAFDGRETAPAAAGEGLFLAADGKPLAFAQAVIGGRAVGVPGTVRMLEMAHAEYGRLPWASLFAAAIRLADNGFPVSARLHAQLEADPHLRHEPAAARYFYDESGKARAIGSVLRNPDLAEVLRRIAGDGSRALHEGEIAQAIVDKVRGHGVNPGVLSMADLAGYRPQRRTPLCTRHAPANGAAARPLRICGFPPPSSGAIAIAQMLGILERTPASALTFADPAWMHYYTEAARLAFADRAQYVADPDFVSAPAADWHSLLDPAYLAARAAAIAPRSMRQAKPGSPAGANTAWAPMDEQPEYGTSHFSIVDAHGNALAMTTTIEDAFGSRQMVKGFLLNNELTDFSLQPANDAGVPIANRVQPNKRPRSSMSPTLVFDEQSGEVILSGGSPGGAMIIHYTAKLLYAMLYWRLSPQEAIDLPNFGSLNGPTLLEEGRFSPAFVDALAARGHEVKSMPMPSGLQAIVRTRNGYAGGADRRREGNVRGE